ncbi:hypothetical protein DFP98_113123 [Cohnella phaseoli]|uniref:Uncharacterized protein n=1 Tax=Cohnella phaseoli TaxID=456490 RepID=A0A3D9JPL3_9BACL|nr:hypothetical protein DFP98_113123 [Cohnella phaseoli]
MNGIKVERGNKSNKDKKSLKSVQRVILREIIFILKCERMKKHRIR